MRRTTIFLFVAVHLGVAALAIVADARAQNPPDCSACTMECTENARQCRRDVDERARYCATQVCERLEPDCLRRCRETHRHELGVCDRQESSCIGNCYI